MTHDVKNGLRNPISNLCAFFCLLSLIPASVVGQSIEPTVVQIPENPNTQDSVVLHLYVGSIDAQLENVYAMEIVYTYSGFQITSPEAAFLQFGDSSWFNDDGLASVSLLIDTTNKKITITLGRSSSDTRSGYGFTVSITDIVVTIEEIGKRETVLSGVFNLRLKNSFETKYSILHSKSAFWSETTVKAYQLYSADGRILRQASSPSHVKGLLERMPPGMYFLKWEGRGGWQANRLIISPN